MSPLEWQDEGVEFKDEGVEFYSPGEAVGSKTYLFTIDIVKPDAEVRPKPGEAGFMSIKTGMRPKPGRAGITKYL